MTSTTTANDAHDDPARSPAPARRRGGFTLVEMLVVIGIIVLLVGLVTPAIMRSRRQAQVTKVQHDFQTIAAGLDEYKRVWNDYPPVTCVNPTNTGPKSADGTEWVLLDNSAHALYTALLEKNAIRAGSMPYGPFVNGEQLNVDRTGALTTGNPSARNAITPCLRDFNDNPILYIPANPVKPNIRISGANPLYVNQLDISIAANAQRAQPLYNIYGASSALVNSPIAWLNLQDARKMLGDDNANGGIDDATEVPATDAPYLLWSAGQDRQFGFPSNGKALSDDITNFEVSGKYRAR